MCKSGPDVEFRLLSKPWNRKQIYFLSYSYVTVYLTLNLPNVCARRILSDMAQYEYIVNIMNARGTAYLSVY